MTGVRRVLFRSRPVHPDANDFFSYHAQAKRILIKAAMDSEGLRQWLCEKDSISFA